MTTDAAIESLEMAMRDYLCMVLEGQERIMTQLADIKAQNEALKAELAMLVANAKARLSEQAADHAVQLAEISVGQSETLAAAKAAADDITAAAIKNASPMP